jgi:hypothetical protein
MKSRSWEKTPKAPPTNDQTALRSKPPDASNFIPTLHAASLRHRHLICIHQRLFLLAGAFADALTSPDTKAVLWPCSLIGGRLGRWLAVKIASWLDECKEEWANQSLALTGSSDWIKWSYVWILPLVPKLYNRKSMQMNCIGPCQDLRKCEWAGDLKLICIQLIQYWRRGYFKEIFVNIF